VVISDPTHRSSCATNPAIPIGHSRNPLEAAGENHLHEEEVIITLTSVTVSTIQCLSEQLTSVLFCLQRQELWDCETESCPKATSNRIF
jgi:hypothetical protein